MIVIADDITGAAEIAGIAVHYGLQVELLTDVGGSAPKADVLVVATDTRSLSEADAVAETRRVNSAFLVRSGREQVEKRYLLP